MVNIQDANSTLITFTKKKSKVSNIIEIIIHY